MPDDRMYFIDFLAEMVEKYAICKTCEPALDGDDCDDNGGMEEVYEKGGVTR